MSRKENLQPLEQAADRSLVEGRPVVAGLSGGARLRGAGVLAAGMRHPGAVQPM